MDDGRLLCAQCLPAVPACAPTAAHPVDTTNQPDAGCVDGRLLHGLRWCTLAAGAGSTWDVQLTPVLQLLAQLGQVRLVCFSMCPGCQGYCWAVLGRCRLCLGGAAARPGGLGHVGWGRCPPDRRNWSVHAWAAARLLTLAQATVNLRKRR